MALCNFVHLEGRLTKNPETKAVGENTVCNFSVAVDEYVGKDKPNKVTFIECATWNHSANFLAKYAKKGDMVTLNGKIGIDEYEKDGQKIKRLKIHVDEVKSFSTNSGDRTVTAGTSAKPKVANDGKAALSSQQPEQDDKPLLDIDSSDLPF